MEDAQRFLGHPEVGFFSMLLIGVLAGWVAERVTASELLNIQVFGFIRTLVSAIIGAILILFIWHWVHNRSAAPRWRG